MHPINILFLNYTEHMFISHVGYMVNNNDTCIGDPGAEGAGTGHDVLPRGPNQNQGKHCIYIW